MFDFVVSLFRDQIIGPLVGIIVTALLGWIATGYARLTGRQLEATHRAALQSALENGIRAAIQLLLDGKLTTAGTVPEDKKAVVLATAATYVKNSVPDAVKHFELTETTLRDLLMPKLPISGDKK